MYENNEQDLDHETGVSKTNQKKQILSGLLISLTTVLLILGLLELVAFLWERSIAQGDLGWTLVASRRMPVTRYGTEDNPYYLLEPNKDYFFEGIPVHINSRGYRNDEIDLTKSPNTYRILNVGDSITFGWEVNLEESYGKQLDVMLNTRDDGVRYEVINVGVPGWRIDHAKAFIRQEAQKYDPDLVILEITLANDIYGKEPEQSKGFIDWLRDHTFTWPFLTYQARSLLTRLTGSETNPNLQPFLEAKAYFPLEEDSPVWNKFWEPIESMKVFLDREGISLLVVVFPTPLQLNSANHPDLPQQILESRTKENNIAYIDFLPIYKEACEEAGTAACEGFVNHLFVDLWMHPNSLGHKLAAEAIYDWQVNQ